MPLLLFRATDFGDDVDRPLKKSDGTWTYFGNDMANHLDKFRRGFDHMIDVWGADHGGHIKRMQAAVTALTHYRWPGNVRELANLIERLAILFPYGVVDVGDLPEKFRAGIPVVVTEPADEEALPVVSTHGDQPNTVSSMPRLPAEGIDLKAHLANMEQSLIRQALEEANGVVAHAAKKLKMRRTTLVEKLRKYGLQRGQELTGL